MNLIVSVAIILLNLYVAYGISCQIPMLFCQYTFRMFQLPFVWKQIQKFLMSCILVIRHLGEAFGRLHHSGNSLGLHRVPYK